MTPLAHWKALQNSLLMRLGGAIAAIALLTVLGMAVSGMVAISTQGSGEAINRAGSLRMQSWYLASLYLAGDAGRSEIDQALSGFDATLQDPAILAMIERAGDTHLASTWQQVQDEWTSRIRHRFDRFTPGTAANPDERARLFTDMHRFVNHIDRLVKHLEDTTEAKILVMRVVLAVALVLTVLVVLLTGWLIHSRLVQPLQLLLQLSGSVGRGDLSVRTGYTGEDELGQLGRAFNLMTEDLSKLYGDLEQRVREKTAALTQSHQSLELLYHSIARLHGAPPGRDTYLAVLGDIERVLEVGHGLICLGRHGGESGEIAASSMETGDANPCAQAECVWCHASDQTRISIARDFRRHLTLPLSDAEHQYGVLILEIPEGRQLEAWQVQLLEALSRHIGVAIGAERRSEQNRLVGLLEERAVIARELHDSLAQSLAYMKIQVSRLRHAMTKGQPTAEVLDELQEGLNNAYRQLRDLLATFRLKMQGQNLRAALEQTASEFARRGEIDIGLDMAPGTPALSPNEEIHVLHIVREALANVLHHAHAQHARVSLAPHNGNTVRLTIEDDGSGIRKSADPHHYGMTIMEERARSLHGELTFTTSTAGGTCVVLDFTPTRKETHTWPITRNDF